MKMPSPETPPAVAPRRRRVLVVVGIVVASVVGVLAMALCLFLLFGMLVPYGPPAGPPSGWKQTAVRSRDEVAGSYVLTGKQRQIAFANGEQRVLAAGDEVLMLRQDGGYHFQHRGIYNGHSQLNCVVTQDGTWDTRTGDDGVSWLVLTADSTRTRVEHRVIPDGSAEQDLQSAAAVNGSTTAIAEQRNASGCYSTQPIDWNGDLPLARNRAGELGFYQDAPALPLESTLFPPHFVHIATLIYVKQRP